MRNVLIVLLIAVPIALASWVFLREPDTSQNAAATVASPSAGAPEPEAKPATDDEDTTLKALLATPLAGATVDGKVTLYDADGLFDYINGAAPIFIERKFRKLAATDLKFGDGEATCDIYDMSEPDNAKSIYDKERPQSAKTFEVGEQGHSGSMALVFRQGRYYVKLTAFDPDAEEQLPKLAALLVERMQ